jgi:hypothetical protein
MTPVEERLQEPWEEDIPLFDWQVTLHGWNWETADGKYVMFDVGEEEVEDNFVDGPGWYVQDLEDGELIVDAAPTHEEALRQFAEYIEGRA